MIGELRLTVTVRATDRARVAHREPQPPALAQLGAVAGRAGGQNGTTLGQNGDGDVTTPSVPLIGRLDEVRLWNGVARSALEIAAAAAR